MEKEDHPKKCVYSNSEQKVETTIKILIKSTIIELKSMSDIKY